MAVFFVALWKMFLSSQFGVLVIVCVLVSSSRALEGETLRVPCEISTQDEKNVQVNCARRHIESISDWPKQIQGIQQDAKVIISFVNNSITNITEIPSIPGSIALKFKNNQIKEIETGAFRNLQRLFYLDLSNNLLTAQVLRAEIFQGPFKDNMYENIALESLYLDYNEIHSIDIDLFQYTPNLTRLSLAHNPIEILDHVTIQAISSALNLESLDLSYTDIDKIPYDAFRGLLALKQIDLSGNKFVTVPESLILVGKTLEVLTFNNNPIVELTDDSFIGLSNLVKLQVGDNDNLAEVKRSTFSPLKKLQELHLCHNKRLQYISHNAFRGMKDSWTLKEVYLNENNLNELSTDLMPWSKLESLGMTGNNWLCNCDLANIVTKQGAGTKFKEEEVPHCAAPMRLAGENITNITLDYCPTFDNTFSPKKSFGISDLKPKHVLMSIFGVATIVCIGMALGLLVNAIKTFYIKKIRAQPIHYVNLNVDSSFA